MKSYDQVKTLSSFRIEIDTREHVNERAKRRYMQFGVPFERRKLDVADYTYDAVLPSGRSILECREPVALIERKMDINELVGCFVGRKKEQFKNEMERAAEVECRIYLLCENASWADIFAHRYRSKMDPEVLLANIMAYISRYNMTLIFCREEESGRLIRKLLYRNLKEALQRGDFDDI